MATLVLGVSAAIAGAWRALWRLRARRDESLANLRADRPSTDRYPFQPRF